MVARRFQALVNDLCRDEVHPLAPVLLGWLQQSPAFFSFLTAHQSKVRRKIRQATEPDALADTAAELRLAAWLLQERRWTLHYEPLAASGGRGPDFRVAAPDHSGAWYLEVTRLRLPSSEGSLALKLARTLADKAGQWPPGAVNVLAVVLPAPLDEAHAALEEALALLVTPSPTLEGRAFARGRPRLSAVLLCEGAGSDGFLRRVHLTLLPGARHPLPPETARRLRRLATA